MICKDFSTYYGKGQHNRAVSSHDLNIYHLETEVDHQSVHHKGGPVLLQPLPRQETHAVMIDKDRSDINIIILNSMAEFWRPDIPSVTKKLQEENREQGRRRQHG